MTRIASRTDARRASAGRRRRRPLPTGTVTFLFTDIEGSSRLWEEHPEAMRTSLACHDALLTAAIGAHDGHVFKSMGDQCCAAFATAPAALAAALAAQRALRAEAWGETGSLRVRMALHTGATEERDGDYLGPTLNRVARLLAAAHGGQILLSLAVVELVRDRLPEGASLHDLGAQRFKDLIRPEQVFQVVAPDLRADFPPLRSLEAYSSKLPLQLTRFIGREDQMEGVQRLLSSHRLVTLTGAGGCGKTRLALEVGRRMADGVPDGVRLVELAALTDPAVVTGAVIAAMDIRQEPAQPPLSTLIGALRSRQLLLILDNCEHLIDACAELVRTLLEACPGLSVLATSRESLRIPGECLFRVPSLSLPEDPLGAADTHETDGFGVSGGGGEITGEPCRSVEESEAVRLFLDRASAALPGFRLTERNAASVVAICRRLDGMPLAIELAAAWLKLLPVEEIAARLVDALGLLTTGSRTALPRHRTLRAAIDWSHDLLSSAEQALLRRLSVFVGGFTVSAVEAVCGDAGAQETQHEEEDVPASHCPSEVLDLLAALVDKSLVVSEVREGEVRHRLLETVRDYGRRRLTSAEWTCLSSRHAAYYLALAEQSDEALQGAEWSAWLERLEFESHNLRAALDWYASDDRFGDAEFRLSGALHLFWIYRGRVREGRTRLERALARADASRPTLAYARAVSCVASMAERLGDFARARDYWDLALGIWRELGDGYGIAWCRFGLGVVAGVEGDNVLARELFEESLRLRREVGDRRGQADSLHRLGILDLERGATEAAQVLLDESLSIYRELGGGHGMAYLLNTLGAMERGRGEHARARALHEEALELSQATEHREGIAFSLFNLARVAIEECDYTGAESLLDATLAIDRETGERSGEAGALMFLGYVAEEVGDEARARRLYQEALGIQREMGRCAEISLSCGHLGRLLLRQGDTGAARALLDEGLVEARQTGDLRLVTPVLVTLGRLESRQGEFATARAHHEEALQMCHSRGDRHGTASALQGLAILARAAEAADRAARLWGAAETALRAAGATMPPRERADADQEIALVRAALGEKAFGAAWTAGLEMDREDAIAYALSGTAECTERNRCQETE